jgi:hypothetical protein
MAKLAMLVSRAMSGSRQEWDSLRRRLEALAADVATEIRAYPRPITACDAQFNHLLELRRLLPLEVQRLAAMAVDPLSTIDAFLRSSPCAAEILALGATGSDPASATSPASATTQ